MAISKHSFDYELVAKLQKGDLEAFDQVFKKYGDPLFKFALKYLKSKEDAEGIVQDVFLKLWENHAMLKKELSFKSYLFTIAYNNICKLFRKRHYNQKFINDTLYENAGTFSQTEEVIDYHSALEQVQQIVSKLPGKQKIVYFKRQEGKTSKEISKEVNLTPGTVDNYISESIKFIRASLQMDNLCE